MPGEENPDQGGEALSGSPQPRGIPLLAARRTLTAPVPSEGDDEPDHRSIGWFWFGESCERPEAIQERQRLWFRKDFATDRLIADRFTTTLARLASGEARRWARRGPHERVAAVIALDQFSRNIFRGLPSAFENDTLARDLAAAALATGEHDALRPVERWFLFMPFVHSERADDQALSVKLFGDLARIAPAAARDAFDSAATFARRHADVIRRFGRFPHRNAALGRVSTSEEKGYLAEPGSGF